MWNNSGFLSETVAIDIDHNREKIATSIRGIHGAVSLRMINTQHVVICFVRALQIIFYRDMVLSLHSDHRSSYHECTFSGMRTNYYK